jgi:hypothetical protein
MAREPKRSVRYPLPREPIEWWIGLPAMVVIAGLLFVVIAVSSRWAWIGWGLGIAFFTWLGDLANRKVPSLRTRVRYLMCVGAAAGFVLGMPFSR